MYCRGDPADIFLPEVLASQESSSALLLVYCEPRFFCPFLCCLPESAIGSRRALGPIHGLRKHQGCVDRAPQEPGEDAMEGDRAIEKIEQVGIWLRPRARGNLLLHPRSLATRRAAF